MFNPEQEVPGYEELSWSPNSDQYDSKSKDEYQVPPDGKYEKGVRESSAKEFEDLDDLKSVEEKAERSLKLFMDAIFAPDQKLDLGPYDKLKKYIRRLIESGDPLYEKRGHILAGQLNDFLTSNPDLQSKYKTRPIIGISENTSEVGHHNTNRLDSDELVDKQTRKL